MAGPGLITEGSTLNSRLLIESADGSTAWHEFSGMGALQSTQHAQAAGGRVLQVEESSTKGLPSRTGQPAKSRSPFNLLIFSQELLGLLGAGLNLVEAIETLRRKARAGAELSTLQKLASALQQGRRFSEVLAEQPSVFPPVYIASVRASERTGNLPQALERFIVYQEQFDVLKRKLVAASIYPAMLLLVGAFVVLFLLGFVVPRFASVYESSARDLPLLSSVMLSAGRFIHGHMLLVSLLVLCAIAACVAAARNSSARATVLSKFVALPGIAERARTFRLGRFYRALSLLLASGVPLPTAMQMVGGLLGTGGEAALTRAREQIARGVMFSSALIAEHLCSPVAESLIKVGERSGQLADMLERSAKFHDEELSRWIDGVSRLLEPILMLLIGLVIGTVVVLMYLPIFDLAGSFR